MTSVRNPVTALLMVVQSPPGAVQAYMILALFAVFEKRRNDVLAVVDRVRHWD